MNIQYQDRILSRDAIHKICIGDKEDKEAISHQILLLLSERRDGYNELINMIIYSIESDDEDIVTPLKDGLIGLMTSYPPRYGSKMFIARCLPRLLLVHPEFVATIFERVVNEIDTHEMPQREILRIKTVALKSIRQAEQKTRSKLTNITDDEVNDTCDNVIDIGDEFTKIDALLMLLDTKVTTKVLDERDFTLFKKVFIDSLEFQVPSLRQRFLAITNKMLKRMRDSIRVVMRDEQKFCPSSRESIRKRYCDYLQWQVSICVDNIYCNKYFGSYTITLSTLTYIIEHIGLSNKNLPIIHLFRGRRFLDSILSCISLDSFEENKLLAIKLLLALPPTEKSTLIKNLELFHNIAYKLTDSVNPAHSLTCEYMFKLLIGLEHQRIEGNINEVIYLHLVRLTELLESAIKESRVNFLQAIRSNSIYPKLTCIRTLIYDVKTRDLKDDALVWKKLIQRILMVSIEACQEISTIVCNMNPEAIGHVPMDLKPIELDIVPCCDISEKYLDDHNQTITSQHLLITGWKTIKECSLSMAALCCQFWWPSSLAPVAQPEPLLDSDSIQAILNFFHHYLKSLRHRGAFEQAYNGFVIVTKRLWPSNDYRQRMLASLQELMSDFKNELGQTKVEYYKNHITRRSAGLPFFVQAIVVSEDKQESRVLTSTAESLLSVLEDPRAEVYQQIHCLNVLKALLKDYNLGEKVHPFIERTLIITMECFKSDDFPIRNCANMLMRVIVDRIFGVNRLRDSIHKRNTLSFEKFFSEYPSTKKRMLHYLNEGLTNRKSLASVHAVIIILIRLRPSISPSEEYRVDNTVKPFIDPLRELSQTCPDFKLRQLAARVVVQLDNYCIDDLHDKKNLYVDRICGLAKSVIQHMGQDSIDIDLLHGQLSMLKSQIRHSDLLNQDTSDRLDVSRCLESLMRVLILDDSDSELGLSGPFLKFATLEIFEVVMLTHPSLGLDWLHELFAFLKQQLIKVSDVDLVDLPNVGPYFEQMVFKTISILMTSGCLSVPNMNQLIVIIIKIIKAPPNRALGLSVQSALVRILRQLHYRTESISDRLAESFEIDGTAAILTPVDSMNQNLEIDSVHNMWSSFCGSRLLAEYFENLPIEQIRYLFDFRDLCEFKDITNHRDRKMNTSRSIEFITLACKSYNIPRVRNNITLVREEETLSEKLKFTCSLVQSLPDCDLKSMSLLFASYLLSDELGDFHSRSHESGSHNSADTASRLDTLTQFTRILDELAGGEHDQTLRSICAQVLNEVIRPAIDAWCPCLQSTLVSLSSTLLKLCQDEELEIRKLASDNLKHLDRDNTQDRSLSGIENFIELTTTRFFMPKNSRNVHEFLDLITRIIFNHSRSSAIDLSQDKESLFDKTRPNIFADHISIIRSALRVAVGYLSGKNFERIKISDLQIRPEVRKEFDLINTDASNCTGDYSWRLKEAAIVKPSPSYLNNREFLDYALESIRRSLDYFNLRNLLIDTYFGHYETLLFRRLAFIKLTNMSTDYESAVIMREIRSVLQDKVTHSCATTIISECFDLIDSCNYD